MVPDPLIGGCFACFARGGSGAGSAGAAGWVAAASMRGGRLIDSAVARGLAGAPYVPGLLAAREGPLLEQAVLGLSRRPSLLLVNATGRDHPRRAGLALHLGWALDLPSIGVTHRPLLAEGEWPDTPAGSHSPLLIGEEQVGWWVRTRAGTRPLAVSPGWRTDLDSAVEAVMTSVSRARTPEPVRQARRLARIARSEETDHGNQPVAAGASR
jgi:deoxyribonuclease V